MTQSRLGTAASTILVFAALTGCGAREDLSATKARLVAPLPGQSTAVAYFELHNAGEHVVRLTGARSAAAGAIEIHTHVREGDMMRMRQLDGVDVTPDSTVAFAPGAHHLMVFRYSGPRTGSVAIELQFQGHSALLVDFSVHERTGQER
jgi:copper(I)-binding protein